ncbi:MAG: hypothetical protein HY321_08545 [Armatimonadetes bacterium]|nr:hypothetical protein [Armatimonadota bacterium]
MPRWSDLDVARVAADLERHFAVPPDEFRPVPWLCYTGDCTEPEVVFALDQMRAQGIRSFFLFPIYGLEVPYLSEEWFEVVRKTVEHCADRGMTVWIYDDYNWPNGSCAGLLLVAHQEHNVSGFRPQWSPGAVAPGESIRLPIHGKVCRALAVTDGGERHPVSVTVEASPDGGGAQRTTAVWRNVLAGPARLLIIASQPNTNHNVANKGSLWLKESTGRGYTDLLNPAASEAFVRMTHEAYYERLAPHFGKTVVGFFDDEPGLYGVTDNADLRRAFQERYGRALEECLEDLFLPGGEDRYRVRAAFWGAAGDLLARHMERIDVWCRDHGVDSTGHFLGEESPANEVAHQGSSWPVRSQMSVPGLDLLACQTSYEVVPGRRFVEFQQRQEPAGLILTVKTAAATARYRGVPRVMVEAYGVMPYWVAPVDLTASTHWLAGLGANLMNDNLLTLSFEGFRKRALAGRHFTTPWWECYRDFAEFAGRCSLMATVGATPASIGLLYPILTSQCLRAAAPPREGPAAASDDQKMLAHSVRVCQQAAEALVRTHHDWEIAFEALLETAEVRDGRLQIADAAFSVIIVPAAHVLSEAVFTRLEAFAGSGGLLVFLGAHPSISIEDGFRVQERMSALAALPNVHTLPAEPDVTWAQLAHRLEPLLEARVRPPLTLVGLGQEDILTAHRQCGRIEFFHLTNMSSRPTSIRATLPGSGPLEMWHPDDGRRRALPSRPEGDGRSVSLEFAPWEGFYLVSGARGPAPSEAPEPRVFSAGARQVPSGGVSGVWEMECFPRWQWEAERRGPNTLPLPTWVRLDPHDQGREEEWCRQAPAEPWIPATEDRLPFRLNPEECPTLWLKCAFQAEHVPADLSVGVDNRDVAEAYLNGERLADPESCTVWDAANRRFHIADRARPGENVLAFRTPVSPYLHPDVVLAFFGTNLIEPIVLSGDFDADVDARNNARIRPPQPWLRLGPWNTQGLSGYAGTVTYRQSIVLEEVTREAWLDLGEVQVAATVRVNGREVGRRCWPPYQLRIDPFLREGENHVEVSVTSSLGGLLKTIGWDSFIGKVCAEPWSGWVGPACIWMRGRRRPR